MKLSMYDFTKPLDDIFIKYFGTTTMANRSYFSEDTTREACDFHRARSNVNVQEGRFSLNEDVNRDREAFLATCDKTIAELEEIIHSSHK